MTSSQCETDYDRAARQAEKIREKLGWDTGIFEMEGEKPKGMHWRTFERLAQNIEHAMNFIEDHIEELKK